MQREATTIGGWWSGSTLRRVGTVLSAITLLAVAVVLAATVMTEQSTGKATAINIAGSLRMQTYLLATRVADPTPSPQERAQLIEAEAAAFEARMQHPQLLAALPASDRAPLRLEHAQLAQRWQRDIKPAALAAAADAEARARFLARVHDFVRAIDGFVARVESETESRLQWLRVALTAALLVIVGLVVVAIALLGAQVFQPLSDLVRLTQRVRAGDFSVRADRTGPDELGQLGRDFNHMVEELGRLYGSMEASIAAKTADLEQKNRALALLYETSSALARQPLDQAALQFVVERVRQVFDVDGAVICARDPAARRGHPLARAELLTGRSCTGESCTLCTDVAHLSWHDADSERGPARIVCVPLLDGERSYGVMPLTLAAGRTLAGEQLELAQLIARNIAAALAAAESREEHRRLALLEERSAIARELHDSLAQSLSYMKIQLLRLATLVDARDPAARAVVDELRDGVASAYRQLRELLTTFRLQLNGKGLRAALRDAADDLRGRTGLAIELHDELLDFELSANEQVHVLQIVREALANVERHAHAKHLHVRLAHAADGAGIEVTIEDDGVGIAAAVSPRHHFGLSIMSDRARLLGGTLDIEAREGGGTRVRLRFAPAARFGRGQAEAAVQTH